jgi:predicted DNA-binding protein
MIQKRQTGLRLPEELLERVDAFAERLQKERPGLEVNRASAIRMLVTMGLEVAEQKKPKR